MIFSLMVRCSPEGGLAVAVGSQGLIYQLGTSAPPYFSTCLGILLFNTLALAVDILTLRRISRLLSPLRRLLS
jgi:hypothetical protein